jgi:hypothetical protein
MFLLGKTWVARGAFRFLLFLFCSFLSIPVSSVYFGLKNSDLISSFGVGTVWIDDIDEVLVVKEREDKGVV